MKKEKKSGALSKKVTSQERKKDDSIWCHNKMSFIFSLFPQPSACMDAILCSQDILCRRKSMELLPIHKNR